MRRFAPLLLLLLVCVAGCRKPWVALGYDHTAPTVAGRTYSWGEIKLPLTQYASAVQAAIQKNLEKKGWQYVPTGGGATVFVLGDVQNAEQLTTYYNAFGHGWSAPPWGQQGLGEGWRKSDYGQTESVALGNPGSKTVIDIFETSSHRLLARGVAQNDYSATQKKNLKLLNNTLHRLLTQLPKQ